MREGKLISEINLGIAVPYKFANRHSITAAKFDARGDIASQSGRWGRLFIYPIICLVAYPPQYPTSSFSRVQGSSH